MYRKNKHKKNKLTHDKVKIFTTWDNDKRGIIRIYVDKKEKEEDHLIKFIYIKMYSLQSMTTTSEKFTISDFYHYKDTLEYDELEKNMQGIVNWFLERLVIKSNVHNVQYRNKQQDTEDNEDNEIINEKSLKNFIIQSQILNETNPPQLYEKKESKLNFEINEVINDLKESSKIIKDNKLANTKK